MHYITLSIIVILCGGYVSGECHGHYTDSTVNSPGNHQCIYYTINRVCHSWV